jgi:hypothetical protein
VAEVMLLVVIGFFKKNRLKGRLGAAMAPKQFEPMTLANMRANGLRSLAVPGESR